MPRTLRADEAGGIYHALNRVAGRQRLFRDDADFEDYERILAAGLGKYKVRLYSYMLMPYHWQIVLRSNRAGQMGEFLRWVNVTYTMRYNARYRKSGPGHLYQGRFKSFAIKPDSHFVSVCRYVEQIPLQSLLVKRAQDWRWGSLWRWLKPTEPPAIVLSPWPISRSPNWVAKVNETMDTDDIEAIRRSIRRNRPFGDERWTLKTAERTNLMSTLRPRGRPQVRDLDES